MNWRIFFGKNRGQKEDYQKGYGDTPIVRLLCQIVGPNGAIVNEVFSKNLSDEHLKVNQIRFVRLIVDYIVKNEKI